MNSQKKRSKKVLPLFVSEDIYNINPSELTHKFDLIILKDVIEHIHNQEKFMQKVEDFLTDDGIIFFGFPSWRMPYGGHQQVANSKILAKTPYYHLLPRPIYKMILRIFGEKKNKIESLLEIKETGISTRRFEKICKPQFDVRINKKEPFDWIFGFEI